MCKEIQNPSCVLCKIIKKCKDTRSLELHKTSRIEKSASMVACFLAQTKFGMKVRACWSKDIVKSVTKFLSPLDTDNLVNVVMNQFFQGYYTKNCNIIHEPFLTPFFEHFRSSGSHFKGRVNKMTKLHPNYLIAIFGLKKSFVKDILAIPNKLQKIFDASQSPVEFIKNTIENLQRKYKQLIDTDIIKDNKLLISLAIDKINKMRSYDPNLYESEMLINLLEAASISQNTTESPTKQLVDKCRQLLKQDNLTNNQNEEKNIYSNKSGLISDLLFIQTILSGNKEHLITVSDLGVKNKSNEKEMKCFDTTEQLSIEDAIKRTKDKYLENERKKQQDIIDLVKKQRNMEKEKKLLNKKISESKPSLRETQGQKKKK